MHAALKVNARLSLPLSLLRAHMAFCTDSSGNQTQAKLATHQSLSLFYDAHTPLSLSLSSFLSVNLFPVRSLIGLGVVWRTSRDPAIKNAGAVRATLFPNK